MITVDQYFGPWLKHPDLTEQVMANAENLLDRVSDLMAEATECGVPLPENPETQSQVSGEQYGGFRPHDCPIGSRKSAHKTGEAVDIYDPNGFLDDWLTDEILAEHNLYREHPAATKSWCHLATRAPKSGKRTFYP